MKNMGRVLPQLGLLVVLVALDARAAAPPAPYFNGFEQNTAGWFDITTVGDGTITRRPSGYSNGGGYADGIASATGKWHARLTGDPCDRVTTNCFGPFTRWGGYSSTFPTGGYLTQVDIYLDVAYAATHLDYRFDWDSSINDNTGNFLQDYVFNAGTSPAGNGFFVNASTNATRSGAFPENPCPNPGPSTPPNTCRTPVLITVSGWYTFRHTFRDNAGQLAVDFDILQKSTGASLAHWTIQPGHAMSGVGGNRYGWFVIEEIPDLAIDNSLRTGICHEADGDGEVEGKDGHKAHMHFHKNSCESTDGDLEEDDGNTGAHFQSTSMNSATFVPDEHSQTVTISGSGLHNGIPVGFTMIAIDNGGLAPPVFSLVLTDFYNITGNLTSGSITVQ